MPPNSPNLKCGRPKIWSIAECGCRSGHRERFIGFRIVSGQMAFEVSFLHKMRNDSVDGRDRDLGDDDLAKLIIIRLARLYTNRSPGHGKFVRRHPAFLPLLDVPKTLSSVVGLV